VVPGRIRTGGGALRSLTREVPSSGDVLKSSKREGHKTTSPRAEALTSDGIPHRNISRQCGGRRTYRLHQESARSIQGRAAACKKTART